uniref:Cl525_1a n=1 Tax=Arundo donax TaxID=35708 RepID=A0A0A9D2J8_ARUDO
MAAASCLASVVQSPATMVSDCSTLSRPHSFLKNPPNVLYIVHMLVDIKVTPLRNKSLFHELFGSITINFVPWLRQLFTLLVCDNKTTIKVWADFSSNFIWHF